MKKIIMVALLLVGISSFAQGQTKTEKKSNKAQREKLSPEEKNQVLLDKITTELKLVANQQEQIKPILAEQTARQQALRDQRMGSNSKEMTSQEREALKQKRQEEKSELDKKWKAILTPEQFKKMKDNEAADREKMRESRAARDNGGWNRENEGDNSGRNRNED